MNLEKYIQIEKAAIRKQFLDLKKKYTLPEQKEPYLKNWCLLHTELKVYEDLESALRRGIIK